MGGFAAINGAPDGPPLLPPIALTDEITALVGAFAVMVALHHRDRTGEGQVIDVSLLESMVSIMGPLPAVWAQRGELQPRLGSGIPYSVPRATYCCADGVWVAVSTSAESVAQRVLALVGVGDDPRFADFAGRLAHRDRARRRSVGAWIGARPSDEVLRAFTDAAGRDRARVHDGRPARRRRTCRTRGTFVEVDGVTMPGPVARLDRTPAEPSTSPAAPLGADTDSGARRGARGDDLGAIRELRERSTSRGGIGVEKSGAAPAAGAPTASSGRNERHFPPREAGFPPKTRVFHKICG